MAEIQFIVERLNQPPFSKGLSLVTFDEKSAFELLSILNDVLSALDERHAVDLRDEQQEMTAARIMEFLQIVKYKFPQGMAM
jgi:hypothetical protein